jgi:ABC-type glycerol-3-phosphate transport system substrate-binding protein
MDRRNVLLILSVAVLLLVACGGSGAPTTSAPTSAPAAAPAAAPTAAPAAPAGGEAVTINFLMCCVQDDIPTFQAVIDAWKKSDPKYANVTVNLDLKSFQDIFPTIETAVASGAVLDLFQADGPDIKHYAYNKVIIPLDKYFTKDELAQFVPINVEAGSYKGTFYSPGIMESCSLMFYNKDMTDAAGVKPPDTLQGWTMDEALTNWRKTVKKDSTGNITVYGLRWGQGVYFGDYEAGIVRRSAGPKGSPTNLGVAKDGITFHGYMDTPEAIKSFEFMRTWFQGDQPVAQKEPVQNIWFNKGAAFYISPDNAVGTYNQLYPNGDFKYGVTGIPYFKDGTQVCHTDSWHFGISPQSKYQDISAALVKFMTGPVGAKIWYDRVRQLPARIELLNTLPEYSKPPQQMFAQAVQQIGTPRIQTPGYTEYQQIFNPLIADIATSDAPIDQLVTDAVSKIESAVAKYKGWDQ